MTPALVARYHQALPARIQAWLHERGVSDAVMTAARLGWTGSALAIPIFDREGRFVFFKFRRDPQNSDPALPKYWSQPGAHAALYGWENIQASYERIVICEGELDRLCLESRGISAVTSTGGAGVFKPSWARALQDIPQVYICFDHDAAGWRGAERVSRLIPHARIVAWPPEMGESGDVTDFFVTLGRSTADFYLLLQAASPPPAKQRERVTQRVYPPRQAATDIGRLKARIPIAAIIGRYMPLHSTGRTFVGRCCFHDDRMPSLVVYPDTRSFYCFGCGIGGDVFRFLMARERLTFREAVAVVAEELGIRWTTPSNTPPKP